MLFSIYVNLLFVYISVYNGSVYVEMFIPYHMYLCMYLNILTDIRSHCRAGAAVGCISSYCFNDGQAAEACSYAALIGLAAAIRIHCRAGPEVSCISHLLLQ